jgi:hypothetical protein
MIMGRKKKTQFSKTDEGREAYFKYVFVFSQLRQFSKEIILYRYMARTTCYTFIWWILSR